jgi:hypothetical protein
MFSKDVGIHPIETCTSRPIYLDTVGKQRDQFSVDSSHLSSSVPKWSHDGYKVAPSLFLEGFKEGRSFAFFC